MARQPKIEDIEFPVFDPLSYSNLGAATAEALFERDPVPMSEIPSFKGEGIYAIYYVGDFEPYQRLSAANAGNRWKMPIYVGKADPPGGREGAAPIPQAGQMVSQDRPLKNRLRHHVLSINAAHNLNIEHFWCKFLLVNQVWVGLAETMMISRLSPIWNTPITGFGNNAPGAGRGGQAQSRWDALHPGRRWAEGLPVRDETADDIAAEARRLLLDRTQEEPPPMFAAD